MSDTNPKSRSSNKKTNLTALEAENKLLHKECEALRRRTESVAKANAHAAELMVKLEEVNNDLKIEIEKRKLAEESSQESEKRYKTLYESSLDAIMILAPPSWKFIAGNGAAVKMFGAKDEKEFISTGPWDVSPEYQPDGQLSSEKASKMIKKAMKEGFNYFEWQHKRLDGNEFFASVLLTRIELNGEQLLLGAVRNITKIKQTEEYLREAKEAAEEANKMKSQFLANTSHELRTPLHGILSFCRFGIKEYATAKPEALLDYFQTIEESAKTLLNLLNDLLDLAKLEAGKMKFEYLLADLNILCEQVIDEFRSVFLERDLTIHSECSVGEKISVDAEKIKQVLRNLISNASKFSPEGSSINICMHERGDIVLVTVCDQGPGVPEDELETVFEKFVQSSKTRTGAGGTGLGLAICREIITAHKGRIWAENGPEGGAVFSFEIPLPKKAKSEEFATVVTGDDSGVQD
jgi:PAS domain S-box-containing protein